jgi:hypothetical protein
MGGSLLRPMCPSFGGFRSSPIGPETSFVVFVTFEVRNADQRDFPLFFRFKIVTSPNNARA